MKDYYAILGVTRTASEAEIKRAYRKLAVSFHPDKNPDPAAEQLFKEINEAYDIVGDPEKRRAYDFRLVNPFTDFLKEASSQPRHRDPAYRRRRPGEQRPKSERQRMLELMAQYLPLANKIILATFFISVVVTIDFFLPKKTSFEKIIHAESTRTSAGRTATAWWTITTDKGHKFDLPFNSSDHFPPGSGTAVRLSVLLNIPVKVENNSNTARIHKSIYSNFLFAPIILLISSTLGMITRKNVEYAFNYAIISFIALMITGLLFFIFL